MLKNVKLPCLAYATTKQVRHLLARSLTQRYAPALAGLTAGQRWRLLARLALGICHPAIPEAERHHLWVTVQHGHWQGTQKCKAQKCKAQKCKAHRRPSVPGASRGASTTRKPSHTR